MAVERGGGPRNTGEVPTIKELIREALDAGKTVRQLEADSGYLVRFQTFQELANHPPKQFPKHVHTITGVAAALNLSESTVVLAYAAGLGIPVQAGSSFALRLPPDVDTIDLALRDSILQLLRAALQSTGPGRRVVPVAEDEPQYFPTPEVERVRDTLPGEVAGEHRKHNG
jgi:hypothetical protein